MAIWTHLPCSSPGHSNTWQLLIPNDRRSPVMQIMHTTVAVILALHSTSLLQSCSTGQLLFQKRCSNSRNAAHLIYHLLFIQLQHKRQQLLQKGHHLIKMRWNCPICRFPRLLFYCYPCLIFQDFGPWSMVWGSAASLCGNVLQTPVPWCNCPLCLPCCSPHPLPTASSPTHSDINLKATDLQAHHRENKPRNKLW